MSSPCGRTEIFDFEEGFCIYLFRVIPRPRNSYIRILLMLNCFPRLVLDLLLLGQAVRCGLCPVAHYALTYSGLLAHARHRPTQIRQGVGINNIIRCKCRGTDYYETRQSRYRKRFQACTPPESVIISGFHGSIVNLFHFKQSSYKLNYLFKLYTIS